MLNIKINNNDLCNNDLCNNDLCDNNLCDNNLCNVRRPADTTGKCLKAFTLIEIIVSVTILSIIMVSVFTVFINTTNTTVKSEMNRIMQENVKNIIETITEDIRKNWIKWVADFNEDCDFTLIDNYKKWTKLCTYNSSYYLAKNVAGIEVRIDDLSKCSSVDDNCFLILKKWVWEKWQRLSNSSVAITNLNFYIANEQIPKVMINISMQPAIWKWIDSTIIEQNNIVVQTTISDRVILKK